MLQQSQQSGFTIIEVLIALAIVALIISLGLFFSMDFAKNYRVVSEESIIVSLLQNARSQSLNNINQVRHGVHFSADPLEYTIFECPQNHPQCTEFLGSTNYFTTNSSYNITISNPNPMPFDIIFEQLNGNCITSTSTTAFTCDAIKQPIIIKDGTKSHTITINSQGRIDW